MNQIDTAIQQYVQTINDLSARLANLAAENFALKEAIETLKKQNEKKPDTSGVRVVD